MGHAIWLITTASVPDKDEPVESVRRIDAWEVLTLTKCELVNSVSDGEQYGMAMERNPWREIHGEKLHFIQAVYVTLSLSANCVIMMVSPDLNCQLCKTILLMIVHGSSCFAALASCAHVCKPIDWLKCVQCSFLLLFLQYQFCSLYIRKPC